MCKCDLCEARNLNCHPWELYFSGKPEAFLVKAVPGLEIYKYEDMGRAIKNGLSANDAVFLLKKFSK